MPWEGSRFLILCACTLDSLYESFNNSRVRPVHHVCQAQVYSNHPTHTISDVHKRHKCHINPFMPEVGIFGIFAWNSYMLLKKIQGTRIWREKNFIIFHCWVMWRSKNGTLRKSTATLYIMYKIMFLISGGGDMCYSVIFNRTLHM